MKKSFLKDEEDAKRLESIIKGVENVTERIAWNGIWIQVKKTIPLYEATKLIDKTIHEVSIRDGSVFMPELIEFRIKDNIICAYSDLTLPADVEKRYMLVCATDLYDVICSKINDCQVRSITRSVYMLCMPAYMYRNNINGELDE